MLLAKGGRTIRNEIGIAVSTTTEVPFTSTAVTTRSSSRSVKPRKSKGQLALESQERFDRARKSENQARKKEVAKR